MHKYAEWSAQFSHPNGGRIRSARAVLVYIFAYGGWQLSSGVHMIIILIGVIRRYYLHTKERITPLPYVSKDMYIRIGTYVSKVAAHIPLSQTISVD